MSPHLLAARNRRQRRWRRRQSWRRFDARAAARGDVIVVVVDDALRVDPEVVGSVLKKPRRQRPPRRRCCRGRRTGVVDLNVLVSARAGVAKHVRVDAHPARLFAVASERKLCAWERDSNSSPSRSKHFLGPCYQCDQIGRFLKVLGNKVPCKSSHNILQQFWAIVKMALFTLNWCGYLFGQLLEKMGLLFTSTSGHTVDDILRSSSEWHFRLILCFDKSIKIEEIPLCLWRLTQKSQTI